MKIGGSQNIPIDVCILASTNQRIESRINSGYFREDMYYRLNVLSIRLPALCERPQDVPLLATHFLHQICRELDAGEKELTQDALHYLSTCTWPGNVRELLNFIRCLAVFCRGSLITQAQVRLMEASAQGSGPDIPRLRHTRKPRSVSWKNLPVPTSIVFWRKPPVTFLWLQECPDSSGLYTKNSPSSGYRC